VPHLAALLGVVLEHLRQADVELSAVTVLCPPSSHGQTWIDDLPDEYSDVRVEVHDPTDRKRLSYLATTRHGRRLYLNRTAVDADQLVVLSRRGYDPLLGYSGSEGALYPALSDEETRKEMCGRLSLAVPEATAWPVRQEAGEVAWLLGAPFMVQVIEGAGDAVSQVVCGLAESGAEAIRLLNARWRVTPERPADTVVVSLSGDPARHDFAEYARALGCAARVIRPNGRIVLLATSGPNLGPGAELLRRAGEPGQALEWLREQTPADMAAAFQWASAARQASIYLLSDLPPETAEELFAVPLENAGQVQRLLASGESVLVLPDAHKTLAVPS
jgi:nickel-dependent lactate racemase